MITKEKIEANMITKEKIKSPVTTAQLPAVIEQPDATRRKFLGGTFADALSVVFKHTLSDAGFSTFEQAKQAAKESLKTFIRGAADQEERRLSRNVEVLRIETTIAAYIELTEIDVFGRDAKFSVTELTTRTES